MPVNPEIRASDADRDHIAAVLRDHTAYGRLTIDEMQERMDATYTARTLGELERLVADLPGPSALPAGSRPVPSGGDHGPYAAPSLRVRWVLYASISLLCVVIWLATSLAEGGVGYFWPVWVIGPWGAALVAKTALTRHGRLAPGSR